MLRCFINKFEKKIKRAVENEDNVKGIMSFKYLGRTSTVIGIVFFSNSLIKHRNVICTVASNKFWLSRSCFDAIENAPL
jgi:hypothetical protein